MALDLNNDLSSEKIRSCLSINTKILDIIYFDSIGSTNDYAKNLIRSGNIVKNNTLIVANQQTAGRGRFGHNFISPSGTGLYMTLILNPVQNQMAAMPQTQTAAMPQKFQMVTIAAAVAVCMAIEKIFSRNGIKNKFPKIKWVNDIFMCYKNVKSPSGVEDVKTSPKKVCGILAEAVANPSFDVEAHCAEMRLNGEEVNSPSGGVSSPYDINKNTISKIIVGIGLNVRPHKFDGDLNNTAGSVFDYDENYDNFNDKKISRAEFAAEIADKLADFALNLDNHEIIKNYRERMIFNTEFHSGDISYIHENKKCYGHVMDVDDDGGLIIKTLDTGEIVTLRSGEIFEVREMKN